MISIPAIGAIFIPLALGIFFARPRYLVPLMLVASIFGAASVLDFNIGTLALGLQPYYFVATLVAIRAVPVLLRYRNIMHRLEPSVRRTVGTLVAFCLWAVASSFVLPVVFRGTPVLDPHSGVGDIVVAFALQGETSPLHWGFGNLAQAVFVVLNLVAVLYVIGSGRGSREGRISSGTLRATITVVSLIALLQSLAAWSGWSFPYSFFNNNPGYSQAYEAVFEDVRRVNSTFTEASSAGGFLAAGALGLAAAQIYGRQAGLFAIFLAVIGLLLTTSTTGYATFLLGGALLLVYLVRAGSQKKLPRNVVRRLLYAVLLAGGGVATLLVVSSSLREAAVEMTFNKGDSLSLIGRVSADLYSIELLKTTYGLGTGLGSNRPSGLWAYLLSNVGLIGTVLFLFFIARLFAQLVSASRSQRAGPVVLVTWMLAGLLIAQGIALPDLSWPPLWAVLIVAASLLVSRAGVATDDVPVVMPVGPGRLPASSVA
jgi:hypothetical protein